MNDEGGKAPATSPTGALGIIALVAAGCAVGLWLFLGGSGVGMVVVLFLVFGAFALIFMYTSFSQRHSAAIRGLQEEEADLQKQLDALFSQEPEPPSADEDPPSHQDRQDEP
jgi:Na+/melibiose symporter-like transporter